MVVQAGEASASLVIVTQSANPVWIATINDQLMEGVAGISNVRNDWHQADIIAELRKRGTTLAAVSRESGLSSSTLANTLSRPWPKGEWIIANYLEIHPSEIWPSRYFDSNGQLIKRTARKVSN
ncbi:transcriptional activator of maltose metabolism (modular protein) [Xenorhabdus bovienii str. Jollieti]|uniref:Transcriptional activator of maltose metabolism (Modular protein) n=1 Tax=Xenorhabdus bovienii (strain SS-2004) TaxID=406818 RepID=D3V6E7_XENBS|nr:transcriptional activator of maltose metabolism (modular protein) [Xenorhabdus bovienii SS-2004]CDH28938.1 transcriptional activator of maltose metabolism (modular protein) [Xenorhabdus bovienii str. Jollieti]